MISRPIVYQYFKDTSEFMWTAYQRSKGQKASDDVGENREKFVSEFLEKVLPPRLTVRKGGEVLDSVGHRTGQLDVLLLRDATLTLHYGSRDSYLAEGVFAAIQVKSVLTREKLVQDIESLKHVRELVVIGSPAISAGPMLNRALRIIFAYEGAEWRTIAEELTKPENEGVVDMVCILSRGALLAKGLLSTWQGDNQFFSVDGKAAALGWLYYYLATYALTFIAFTSNIQPYFEPINEWRD